MALIYHLIVFYITLNLVVYLLREKRFRWQASAAIVLVMFLLRLFLIK
jgi:hypothetical protein